jgi:hypothetical protein
MGFSLSWPRPLFEDPVCPEMEAKRKCKGKRNKKKKKNGLQVTEPCGDADAVADTQRRRPGLFV